MSKRDDTDGGFRSRATRAQGRSRQGPPSPKGRHGTSRRSGRQPGTGRRDASTEDSDSVWLFGIHAVRDALANPERRIRRIVLTPNARQRLAEDRGAALLEPHAERIEIADPRRFPAPLDPSSVHQGAAIEAEPLSWGGIDALAAGAANDPAPVALALDRVTDPHNVGAILRSAEVFGAAAVIAPRRHSAPETGALAKAASGALERQPYLRPVNLGDAIQALTDAGFAAIGLDGEAPVDLDTALVDAADQPLLLVLGAEGPGLRSRTKSLCTSLARIPASGSFASLNVSNAAAVALYAASIARRDCRKTTCD
ncbi:MAG: RNA methyltransferase [Pseudomonadota bacterium]